MMMKRTLRQRRIGIDQDDRSRLRMLMRYFNARLVGYTQVFETGRGFHFKIWRDWSSAEQNIGVRCWLGDDPEQIWWDQLRHEKGMDGWINTLFGWKRFREGDWTGEKLINPLAPPFWEARVAKMSPRRNGLSSRSAR